MKTKMSKITPTTTPATTPPRTAGLSFLDCAVSGSAFALEVAVGLGWFDWDGDEVREEAGDAEEMVRQPESCPACTKNGGDWEKIPAVCEVSTATATYKPCGTSTPTHMY